MDKLKASPQARIVNLSSLAHTLGKNRLDFDDLMFEKSYDAGDSYNASKLSNVYFTKHLAQKLKDENVENLKVVSVHPGVVRTELGRYFHEGLGCCGNFVMKLIFPLIYLLSKSPWYGTQTQLHCCLAPYEHLESGSYYSDCKVKKETLKTDWKEQAEQLWKWSEEAVSSYSSK